MSTETVGTIMDGSPGRPPPLSHSSAFSHSKKRVNGLTHRRFAANRGERERERERLVSRPDSFRRVWSAAGGAGGGVGVGGGGGGGEDREGTYVFPRPPFAGQHRRP